MSTDYLLGRTDQPNGKTGTGVDPVYLEVIQRWEKEKRTPAELKEFLVVGLPYVELIKLWRAKGMSPEKVKEIWGRILEIKSIL